MYVRSSVLCEFAMISTSDMDVVQRINIQCLDAPARQVFDVAFVKNGEFSTKSFSITCIFYRKFINGLNFLQQVYRELEFSTEILSMTCIFYKKFYR